MYSLANISQVASSSTSRTSSVSPNASGFPATCPTDDRKTIRDNSGVAYQVLCASDVGAVNGGGESGPSAPSSFNDCFALCTAAVVTGGAGRCTGFTYVGQVNGAGGGTCYLKSGTSYTIGSAGTNFVGAIRQADAVSSSSLSSVVLASTTASSVVISSSSAVVVSSSSSVVVSSSSSVVVSSSSAVVVSSSSAVVVSSSSAVVPISSSSVVLASTTSSRASSSSAVATGVTSYSCPANDQQVITNGGTQYQLRCGYAAAPVTGSGVYFRDPTIRASFNECLQGCTTNAFESPAGSGIYPICTGYTFSVTDTAAGTGTCNYRQQNPLFFDIPNQYFTGLIKVQYYQAPSSSVAPSPVQTQTLTYTTVSYATIVSTQIQTFTTSYPVVSTQIQTITTSYPVTFTQVSTAPG